jgi:hypothetical protein
MSLVDIAQELALTPFASEFPAMVTWDELIFDK